MELPNTDRGSSVASEPAGDAGAREKLRGVLPSGPRAGWTWALLSVPGALALLVDALHRGERLLALSPLHTLLYAVALLESWVVWALLLYASSRRDWVGQLLSVLFVVGFTFAFGGQVYFFDQYRAYLTQDLTLFAASLTDSVISQLAADWSSFAIAKLPFLSISIALVVAARGLVIGSPCRGRGLAMVAPLSFIACWFIPLKFRSPQAATPDTLYLNAMGAYVRSQLGASEESQQVRPQRRASRPVAPIHSEPAVQRNVVFVLTESLRADAVCSAHDEACTLTPYTNALLPRRSPLRQLRALDSTTAISLPVLWAGVAPNASHEVMHSWPLLWDYARAAGFSTAYWTSQNLFFGNARAYVENLGADHFVSATQLDGNADLDMGADERLLADYVISRWQELEEPFFVMIHTSNAHYPYFVDEQGPRPFQPAALDKSPEATLALRNYYQNAVLQQDRQLARMLGALRSTPAGERSVVLYTSDHGEAFRDHHQLGHTFSMFDEEIKVPGFVDAPEGTLTELERRALDSRRDAFTFHPDLAVTALDLMGVLDDPALDPFRDQIVGYSLLRDAGPVRTLPLTNCASVWSCAFENWGLMRGPLKVFARTPYDTGWQCFDLHVDPGETQSLDTPPCRALIQRAHDTFGRAPY